MNMSRFFAAWAGLGLWLRVAGAATVVWDDGAAGNDNWSDADNWDRVAGAPTSGDIAQFRDAGVAAAGTDTSVLDIGAASSTYTIGGLQFWQTQAVNWHQLNLNGRSLAVDGDVRAADYIVLDSTHTAYSAMVGDGDDVFQIGAAGNRRNLTVGEGTTTSSTRDGEVSIAGIRVVAHLDDLRVGVNRRTTGSVTLGAVGSGDPHSIKIGAGGAGQVYIGVLTTSGSGATAPNPVNGSWTQTGGTFETDVDTFYVGSHVITGNGSYTTPTGLLDLKSMTGTKVKANTAGIGATVFSTFTGTVQVDGGTFEMAIADDLSVGARTVGGSASVVGLLDAVNAASAVISLGGSLHVGRARNARGDILLPAASTVTVGSGNESDWLYVGVADGVSGTGTADGRLAQPGGSFTANVAKLWVGTADGGSITPTDGDLELTNMTGVSLTVGSLEVAAMDMEDAASLNGSLIVSSAAGGTFTASVAGNARVGMNPQSGENLTNVGMLDLSAARMTGGFAISGDLTVGYGRNTSGTVKLGSGNAAAANVAVGDAGNTSPEIGGGATGLSGGAGLLELYGTGLAIGTSLAVNNSGTVKLYYDTTGGFDPAESWLSLPDEGSNAADLAALITAGKIEGYVDDVKKTSHDGKAFAVYQERGFAFVAFAAPPPPPAPPGTVILVR